VGARDGVKPGQPVIDAHGVMGQVIETLPTTSVVMLVTDPNNALPVTVERTGLRTIAYGSRDGDRLLTSGLGGRFPPGFPVGEITRVSPAATGMFLEAQAQPSADINRSNDVLLLHDQAEPVGPPEPVAPAGPPADLAPAGAGAGQPASAAPAPKGKP
jgi:rod shape-determining protein MreC